MPVFAYRGVTAGGSDARGVVDADSTRGAWQLLRTRGIYPATIAAEVPARARAPAGADLIALTRRLAHLLAAGLPLTEARLGRRNLRGPGGRVPGGLPRPV